MADTQRILITGAGSGIGAGVAEGLLGPQRELLVSDRDEAAAEAVAARLREQGGRARALTLDVCSEQSVQAAVEAIGAPVDVLINNAGLQHVSALEDFPMDKWDQLIQVMLVGVARLSRALLPGMREQGRGRIINIGSIHALVASPYKSAYVAAKHGLMGFTRVLALETADTDITINTVCPSYVLTPLVEKQIADQAKSHGIPEAEVIERIMLAPMPKKAFISMQEMAGICDFLIGEHARNITGQAITVDGGWTAR